MSEQFPKKSTNIDSLTGYDELLLSSDPDSDNEKEKKKEKATFDLTMPGVEVQHRKFTPSGKKTIIAPKYIELMDVLQLFSKRYVMEFVIKLEPSHK